MTNCRAYGSAPYQVVVIHGGPGAPGSAAGICRGLAGTCGVLEILQSKNSIDALIEEMLAVMDTYQLREIVLIGHSWGAWLSFLFAAQYPERVRKLILVGSGLFDEAYYPQLIAARSVTAMPAEQAADVRAAGLSASEDKYNPNNYCLLPNLPNDLIAFHQKQFDALMGEIIPMRASGELLGYADNICCPVIGIHGRNDPHVVDGVRKPLASRLPNFTMHVLDKCGHEPWNEYYARDMFFKILINACKTNEKEAVNGRYIGRCHP